MVHDAPASAPAVSALVDRLAALPGSDTLFNPYSGGPGADIRRANLLRYLSDMFARRPHTVLIFEAPGYRGCRWTGIPVTSERIMLRGIPQWNLFGAGYRPTSDVPRGIAEMTATILWGALLDCAGEPPLIWNSVPLHPHRPGDPLTNRPPALAEQRIGAGLIHAVLETFGVRRILAVGRTAQRMLAEQGCDFAPLRHPSQGGKPDFIYALRHLYAPGSPPADSPGAPDLG